MLAEDPRDEFLRYSLAMELRAEGRLAESLALFRELQAERRPHVPSFFMAGQQLAAMGAVDEARDALRRGIDAARAQGDTHAAGEMSEFLASLGPLGE
jgi:hypothetical protein